MRFTNQVALVTGAASGIGRALASELARRGAIVEGCDLHLDGAAARSGEVRAERVDVSDARAVTAWVESARSRHGRIDLLFNNAGIAVGGEAHELVHEDWQKVIDVNLRGVINGVQAAYPLMVKQGSGHLVNIASVAGLVPYPFALPYTTTKHAVVGLSTALRAEAAEHGVRVSVVCPGAIKTAIWERAEVKGWDRREVLRRIRWWTSAEDCAQAILAGVARNQGVIPVTAEARLFWWLQRLSPALAGRISQAVVARLRRDRARALESENAVP
ncbi:MAG: SDR family oxidoreductase [Deltaproteobacteria bacterium]|nr:SDR family oxidoreductase [Deltaproteobacteria bacterium]